MSEVTIVVDHLRLNYSGPFDANALFKHINVFLFERGFDLKVEKEFEQNTKTGKQMEWLIMPWKRISDYTRHHVKVRILVSDYNKVDAVIDKKKVKIGNGRIVMYLDGYIEYDQEDRWESIPFFQFLRTIYNKFIFKVYTERFEQRLSHDVHHLHHTVEQFLNVYKHYKIVSRVPPFVAAH